jgi:hypothetical protein
MKNIFKIIGDFFMGKKADKIEMTKCCICQEPCKANTLRYIAPWCYVCSDNCEDEFRYNSAW